MGDQQQRIEALRAAMTSIQERDPDAPVPDFLVVDTSVSVAPVEVKPAQAQPTGASSDQSGSGAAAGADSDPAASGVVGESGETESDEDESTDEEFLDLESGDLEFVASAEARPLIEPEKLSEDPVSFSAGESVTTELQAEPRTGTGVGPEAETGPEADAEAEAEPPVEADAETEPPAEAEPESPADGMAALRPEEQYEKARAVVLRRLTGSPKSRHQLAVALKEKEFSPDVISRVLDRMEEVHLVNDTDFARTWVRGRHELKNLGKSALRRELREKGISELVAQDALEQISAEDEGAAARELVRRKLQGKPVPTGPSPEERAERDKVTRRLVSMLARRGHSPGAAFQIVREMIQEHSGE
ncbi:RecX family transcriptional regulator [Nesterenkonia sp. AN1]|uniref:Regulatory protein RecX n=1 Tax=Nesterenkonia aurantiaca TaxID=1436010 RepID=A0A4R7G3I5_9MICC|nr:MULTISPECIES: regulatory protein RecX [Nesterenkonia]EXF25252.1 RecX family transcriptional regulator [Nesterenkonia sp. AN1]TDS85698.1 SOS response regulatory protein OraA/RecX [Nesterenkonia aurantiaca]